jgi:MFS family permease
LPRDSLRLGIAIFFAIAATNLLIPLLPSITAEFDISFAAAGLLVSSFILARLVSSVFVGWLGRRLGTARLASLAFLLLVVGSLVGMVSPTVEVLLGSRLLTGAGVGIISTLALAALADLAPDHARGQVMSLFQIAHNAGIALYPVLGGVVGLLVGWRATFLVVAVGAILSAWFLLPVLKRVGEAASTADGGLTPAGAPAISRTRRLVGIGTVLAGVFAVMFNRHGVRNTLLPLYGGAVLGLGPVAIATGVAAMSIVGLVIAMPGAIAGDRLGHRRLIVAGLLALAVGDLAFLLTGDYVTFLIASIALGLGDFFIGSQSALLASMAPPHQRTQVLGGFRVALDAGALAGPIALGWLMDAGGVEIALVVAAVGLGVAAIASRLTIPFSGSAMPARPR